jgi:hypothetical protein
MVCNPTEEYCQCRDGDYRLYDFYNERWICQGFGGDMENDSLIRYNYLFNGNQFGTHSGFMALEAYNHIYNLILDYNKEKQAYQVYRVGNPIGTASSSLNGHGGLILAKEDPVNGDSIYIRDMFLFTSPPFFFEYNGERMLLTGRGRISPDRDTLDMTVYFLDVRTINPDADPDKPIDVSGALDIRKMTLLSSRVLPRY